MSESVPSTQNSGLYRQIHYQTAFITLAFVTTKMLFHRAENMKVTGVGKLPQCLTNSSLVAAF
jgi:hypothetical protein